METPLDYAAPALKPVSEVRFRGLATLELTRAVSIIFTAVTACLLLYVTARHLKLRHRSPVQ